MISENVQDNVSTLLPLFESCLSDAPDTANYDALRHSVVVLMGTLAKHLDTDNPKVRPIVGLLIETLSTPSQQVTATTTTTTTTTNDDDDNDNNTNIDFPVAQW